MNKFIYNLNVIIYNSKHVMRTEHIISIIHYNKHIDMIL